MKKPSIDHLAIIAAEHIQGGKSLRLIEREMGLANGCLSNYAKKHGVPVRSKSQQALMGFKTGAVERKVGALHWAYGQTKETARAYALHSERMTKRNPTRMPGVVDRVVKANIERGTYARASERMAGSVVTPEIRQKIAQSVAPQLLERMSEREQVMLQALIAFDPLWIPQYQTTGVILDFARPDLKIAFEIDVGGHKLNRSAERDAHIVGHGWTIFRIRSDHGLVADYYTKLFRIAEQVIPEFKCPDELPSRLRCNYRVIVRSPENPAGLSVKNSHDPAIALLRAQRQYRLETASMSQNLIANTN